MGIQKWGALGGFQNKVGPAVGAYVGGQNVIRALPHASSKPATERQLDQRARFGLVTSFQKLIGPLIRVGFQDAHNERQTAFNAAFVQNYRHAVTGTTAANFAINYPKFMYSKGDLSVPYAPGVEVSSDAQLDLSWLGLIMNTHGAGTDLATVVVYNPVKEFFVTVVGAAPRSALSYAMILPADFSGDEVQAYMSFVRADGQMTSNSVYLGAFLVL